MQLNHEGLALDTKFGHPVFTIILSFLNLSNNLLVQPILWKNNICLQTEGLQTESIYFPSKTPEYSHMLCLMTVLPLKIKHESIFAFLCELIESY